MLCIVPGWYDEPDSLTSDPPPVHLPRSHPMPDPNPASAVPASAQHDPARLDQAAQQLQQELQAHGQAVPEGAGAAPSGAASGLLGNLVSHFHLSPEDIEAMKGLGLAGLKLALKIAMAGGFGF